MSRSLARAGVTRLEAALVAGGLLLVGGTAAVLAAPREASVEQRARQELGQLQRAAGDWHREHGACPTISVLRRDGALAEGMSAEDPWGERYRLSCGEEGVVVRSSGKDRRPGTADDLSSAG